MMIVTKILGGTTAALTLAVGILYFMNVQKSDLISSLQSTQNEILLAAQSVTGNKKLVIEDVDAQIFRLGDALDDAKDSIDDTNKKIEALSNDSIRAIEAAKKEIKARDEAVRQARSTAERLRKEAMVPTNSDNLEAVVREVQDLVYEEGV